MRDVHTYIGWIITKFKKIFNKYNEKIQTKLSMVPDQKLKSDDKKSPTNYISGTTNNSTLDY